jgi:hypothetical protein
MRRLLGWLLVAALSRPLAAQPLEVPEELRDWEGWVLDGREHLRCPMLDGGSVNAPDGRDLRLARTDRNRGRARTARDSRRTSRFWRRAY